MMVEDIGTHSPPLIAFLTDFGVTDGYVAAMKAVIFSIYPTAPILDITHHIHPQNVRQAAYVLMTIYKYLPSQAIVVAVVDPGVGSSRKPIAIETNHGIYVGPDNGIFSYVLNQVQVKQIVMLQNPKYQLHEPSTTFHGRDIFSPAAAYLAKGLDISQFGPSLTKIERLPAPILEIGVNAIRGEIIHIDHYGNLITSIGQLRWTKEDMLHLTPNFAPIFAHAQESISPFTVESCSIEIGDYSLESLHLSYSAVPIGKIVPLINSVGHLEIAINQGNAAKVLQVGVGDSVYLKINH